jgi:hypothetical protein
MERYYKALIGTVIEVIMLMFGIIAFTSKVNLYYNILVYTMIVITTLIILKINYEYFETPFYKSLKYPWENK